MLELDAPRFFDAQKRVNELRLLCLRLGPSANLQIQDVKVQLNDLPSDLRDVGANFTAMAAERLLAELSASQLGLSGTVLGLRLSEIERRFLDELESVKMFVADASKAHLFENGANLLSANAQYRFPDILKDCDEAGNCYALNRPTACVFHIMRAAEAVVRELAKALGATFIDKNDEILPWGKLTANIKSKIDAMDKGPRQESWREAESFLHSCNRAFRTKTAHPEKTYSAEDAKDAFDMTIGFIKSVAKLV